MSMKRFAARCSMAPSAKTLSPRCWHCLNSYSLKCIHFFLLRTWCTDLHMWKQTGSMCVTLVTNELKTIWFARGCKVRALCLHWALKFLIVKVWGQVAKLLYPIQPYIIVSGVRANSRPTLCETYSWLMNAVNIAFLSFSHSSVSNYTEGLLSERRSLYKALVGHLQ